MGPGGRPQPLLIKDEPWDRDMMHKCFDGLQPKELVDHVLNRPLTCAGAMLGSGPAVLEYFRMLMEVRARALFGVGGRCWRDSTGLRLCRRRATRAPNVRAPCERAMARGCRGGGAAGSCVVPPVCIMWWC